MGGNKCRALLKKALDLENELPDKYSIFAVALHWFSQVATACFGKKPIEVNGVSYEDLISEFHKAYLAYKINTIPKVHAVLVHVPEWCNMTGKRPGSVSEQASESAHHDFKNTWEHHNVALDNPRYLCSSSIQYNSLQI